MSQQLFTVGHSNLSIKDFINLLIKYQINAIADVRSYAYSSYLPHFNQDLLKFELLKAKIKYVFLGDELGARPKDLSCYINGRAIYSKIANIRCFSIWDKKNTGRFRSISNRFNVFGERPHILS